MASRFPAQDVPPVPSLAEGEPCASDSPSSRQVVGARARRRHLRLRDGRPSSSITPTAGSTRPARSSSPSWSASTARSIAASCCRSRACTCATASSARTTARPFACACDRDANAEVHREIGRTMRVSELADAHDHDEQQPRDESAARPRRARRAPAHARRVRARRASTCVAAWRTSGRSSTASTTASPRDGLVGLLRLIDEERAFSPALSRQMLDILHGQQFRSGIPAGLPREARVAHKTGEISTIAHDAGLVYLPGPQAVRDRRAHRVGARRRRAARRRSPPRRTSRTPR